MRRIRKETSDFVNSIDRLILEQVPENSLHRIIQGLMVAGLAVGLISLLADGGGSAWLILAAGLLVGTGTAYVLNSVGQFVVAAVVLVVVLVSTVAGMLLHPNAPISFVPYLFVPIVVLTGLILPPLAVVITALSAVALTATMLVLTGEAGPGNLLILLPPLGLIIIAGLLTAEGGYQIQNLQNLWLDSKRLLRERTWESVELQRAVRGGQRQINQLERELSRTKSEQMDRNRAKYDRLLKLLTGAVQELDHSTRALEQMVERVEELSPTEDHPSLFQELWAKIFHLSSLKVGLEDLARLEHEEIRLERQAVDMADLIKEVAGTARGLAREKKLTLTADIPAGLPRFYVDAHRLRQALLRILSNAIQYTDEGTIEIQVEQNEYELLILISDTGIGLQPEESELIFQSFGRASGDAARRRQGPGLGLAISERLVKLHGGHLWVTSIPGVGSTFYVALPLAQIRQNKPASAKVPAVVYPAANGPARKLKPEFTPIYDPLDPEATLLSRRRLAAKSDLGPVARLSPTYVNRLGLLFFGLLLLFSLCVALLAFRNGISSYWQTSLVGPSSAAESGAAMPTRAATFKKDAAVAPSPTASPTRLPYATATPAPSLVPPTATNSPSPPLSPEPPPPSPSPTALFPTPLATATPPPTHSTAVILETKSNGEAAALPQPTVTTAATETQPTPTRRSQSLSFITQQNGVNSISRLNLGDGVGDQKEMPVQTLGNSGISWSPARQLLFTAEQQDHREIYVAGADGSSVQQLTAGAGDSTQPAWSPDGRQIAFSSARTGNFEIFVMGADGSNPRQLTSSRGFDEWPVWSADGTRLAFVSDRDGNVEIYSMAADGSNQQRLTDHPADDWPASWSPAGNQLVFASNRDGNWNLYLLDVTGGGAARLTNDPANERDPAWSPDGRTIAFAYDGEGNWDIYTLPVSAEFATESNRNEWRQISRSPLDERYPAWQR